VAGSLAAVQVPSAAERLKVRSSYLRIDWKADLLAEALS
jgi:hypothetical protein